MKKRIIRMLAELVSIQADLMMAGGALLFIVSAMCWGVLNSAPAQWVQDLGVAGGVNFGIGCVMQLVLLITKSKVKSIL